MMKVSATKQLVVVGNGMVGHRLIEELVQVGALATWKVIVIGEESVAAYDRVHLSELFSGKSIEECSLMEPGYYQSQGVEFRAGTRVSRIDRELRTVELSSGENLAYDALVLATGSSPFVPPIPGADGPKCFVYRTLDDVTAISKLAKRSKTGVVVGGGLLGLEAANALLTLGLDTQVVELAPRLMAVQLDEGGGAILRSKIEELGITVHTNKQTQRIDGGTLHFGDGSELQSDMVVFSAGIRARDELARACDLAIGMRGGVAIDALCRSSDDAIFAIGECASYQDTVYGLVAPGYDMARVVAGQLAANPATVPDAFAGGDMSAKLKLLGIEVASFGDAHGSSEHCRSYVYSNEAKGVYKRLVVSEDGSQLLGGSLVGDADDYNTLRMMAAGSLKLPANPESLLVAGGSDEAGLSVASFSSETQICSCNNVSKGDLCAAIDTGALDIGTLKRCTKAGAGCGGCVPLVSQVLDAELLTRGLEINHDICEHFSHSRQELYHLVRMHEIKSFAQLIERHGRGFGCEICKPTVTSILASCWNEHILTEQHTGLQDTNDRFLANIQRNGTYSVVPRVPGGEITPAKLIAIGKIALKYDLYTKITGGQRVDLFGAQLHELPEIWKELIAEGFESGHAYGKSLRTVKTCVGTNWCRYGVQDSVGLGIRLENRYKGLRAPHKIKMAVSGCARECAEAQSKDVGIIATESGYNLYVCGNGGMTPRHASLLACDLDEETLVRYVDRLLMFYIRTAARLQRTARWLESLEGGLDYVKAVIVEDSLGIASELEQEMTHIVGSYRCEWDTAVNTPETLQRFSTFVNSEQRDESLVYIRERGQRRPA